jgi:ABC-2 type transport system ATP-binding protein
MSDEPIIRTAGLTKAYGEILALDDLTIDVPRAAVGFLGANGAGKSTLIGLLLGLRQPTTGSMSVLGHDVATEATAVRARVGYMPEADCLPRDVTAAEFVGHMAAMSGLPPRAARLRAAETLYHCGLEEERYRPIGGFSTGMKQRVKLAQAIVHDPELVFLDEPTNGLDPMGRDDMLSLIERINRQLGINVVLSSHILDDVERVCDYVVMLDQGKVVAAQPLHVPEDVAADLHVRIDGEPAAFLAVLEQRGIHAVQAGIEFGSDEFVIRRNGADTADVVRDAAVSSGVPLRLLRPATRTLADLYIDSIEAEGTMPQQTRGRRKGAAA